MTAIEIKEKWMFYRDNPEIYFAEILKIKTKMGEVKPFIINDIQRKILDKYLICKAVNKPFKAIILKARQEGVSTLSEGLIDHRTTLWKNRNSKIVAHDVESTDVIFSMANLFHSCKPQWIKPTTKYSNRKELRFEKNENGKTGLRSRISIDCADNLDVGRGDLIHNLHGSEVAFWRDADTLMLAINQAIPENINTGFLDCMIILESTANGVGDYFYRMWQDAKAGLNGFEPIFIAWFENPEYRKTIDKLYDIRLDDDEIKLKEAYKLSDEQIYWRRETIKNKCNGSVEQFRQEYPSNDEEAFLVSGNPIFDTEYLRKLYDLNKEIYDVVELEKGKEIKIIPMPGSGRWHIYKLPNPKLHYVCGSDVANEGTDMSTIDVICVETCEQVAHFFGKLPPDELGKELAKGGLFYNIALVCPEVNNHGLTTLMVLKYENYPNIYFWKRFDELNDVETKKLGWETNVRTKPIMIDNLRQLIRAGLKINEKATIMELITFIRHPNGYMGAQLGCRDDRVISLAISGMLLKDYSVEQYAPVVNSEGVETKKQITDAERHLNSIENYEDDVDFGSV